MEVLVVGAGSRAAEFISRVEANPLIGVHVAGVLCNQTDKAKTKDQLGLAGVEAPLLGAVADLPNVLRTHVVDTVVVALPFADFATITEVTHVAEEQGKQVHVLLDGLASKLKDSHFDVILGHPALSVSPGAHRTLELAGKRIVDFCGALSALVCMSPLFVVLGVLIKFDSPGPVFFKQKRVGLNGRLFTLYKFRTMVVDAESRLAQLQHLNEMTGPVFKIRNDPRITRVGRFLRRTSLDELPQFINVLLGQMSIVGPRPPLPHEVEQYEEWQLRRLSVKPGLTCFWQVEGRNDIPFDQWVRLDLEYIDTWSLTTDVKLILKTIPVMFGAKGA